MFRSTAFFRNSILLAFALSACVTAYAQRGQQRPRIVLEALDLDHDGGLLAIEIQAAPSSLRALDKDGDGEISMEEMTPRRQDAGADPELLVKQLMQFDKNGDGYLTQDELPERMQGLLARADANHDGKLAPDEIRASAAKSSGPRGRGENSAEQVGMMHLDPVFDVLDADHNGTFSTEEIQAASVHLMVLDKNKDGVISADEMTMRQQGPTQRALHIVGEFDTNHDGRLSPDEVPDGLRTRFDDADKNHDGFLDQSELEQMFASMPLGGFGRKPDNGSENNRTLDTQPKGPNH